MPTTEQHDASVRLVAAMQTPEIATPPVVTSALSPLAPAFQPTQEWPALPVQKACPKTRLQGRARSLRV